MLYTPKGEARRYRRKNTDLSWWNSSIKKNKEGTFDIRDSNSHLAITKNGDGEIAYSATASPLQIGETRDVKAPDPVGVNYSTGIFGDKATEVYIGDGDWVNLGNDRSKQSAETVAMLFPIGGPAKSSIWTATKLRTAVQNAFSHWKKHAAEFPEYLNAKQYVQGAKNFLSNSPKGTLTKVRPNGDILKYHPGSNTFGVMNSNGVPRTMFRPTDGMKYWLRQ